MIFSAIKSVAQVAVGVGEVVGMAVGVGCDVVKVAGCTALKVGDAVVRPAAGAVTGSAKAIASVIKK